MDASSRPAPFTDQDRVDRVSASCREAFLLGVEHGRTGRRPLSGPRLSAVLKLADRDHTDEERGFIRSAYGVGVKQGAHVARDRGPE